MAVYAKGNKRMASVGAGAARVRKTFPTHAEATAWEQTEEAAALGRLPVSRSIATSGSLRLIPRWNREPAPGSYLVGQACVATKGTHCARLCA